MANRFAFSTTLSLILVLTGLAVPGTGSFVVAQTSSNPCGLLTIDEIEPLAAMQTVVDGIANATPSAGRAACRYEWGAGTGRYTLDIIVSDASRMYAGTSPDAIKQGLASVPTVGSVGEAIPDIGDAAAFKSDSPFLATTTAFMKGQILQLNLDGYDARAKKDQVIGLLKAASARL
jgi:hypothetical protein